MNGFRATGLVTLRELRERGLSRSYLISWLVLVFLIGVGFTLPKLLGDGDEERTYRIGLVGSENGRVIERARSMVSGAEPSIGIETSPFSRRADAVGAVADGAIDAALVNGKELIVEEAGGSSLVSMLQQAARSVGIEEMVASGEVTERVVALLSGEALEVAAADPDVHEDAEDRQFVIGQAALVLLFMAIMMTGSWVLLGVTEEKTSRVAEVLLSALRPWQILAGKILGVGILGLLQFSVLVGGVVLGVRLVYGADLIPEVDGGLLATLLVWFVLGYSVYAIGYAAVGAVASRPEDAQNAAFPMTMVSLIGYFTGIFYVGQHPDSVISAVLSFVPLTAPFVIPVRAVSDSVAIWEQVAAVAVMVGFGMWLVRVAGKVYAGGVFNYRSRVKLREAVRSAEF